MSVQAHSIKQTKYQTILKQYIKQTEYQTILKQYIKQTEYQTILKQYIKQTEYQTILMKPVHKTNRVSNDTHETSNQVPVPVTSPKLNKSFKQTKSNN